MPVSLRWVAEFEADTMEGETEDRLTMPIMRTRISMLQYRCFQFMEIMMIRQEYIPLSIDTQSSILHSY